MGGGGGVESIPFLPVLKVLKTVLVLRGLIIPLVDRYLKNRSGSGFSNPGVQTNNMDPDPNL